MVSNDHTQLMRPLSVLKSLATRVRSVRSLSILLLIKYNEIEQLIDLKIDPLHYNDPLAYAKDRLLTTFLSKVKGFSHPEAEARAFQSFSEAEEINIQTNLRLRTMLNHGFLDHFMIAKGKIASILGSLDCIRLDDCGFGPGTSRHLKGNDTSVYRKVTELKPTVTGSAAGLCSLLLRNTLWEELLVRTNNSTASDSFQITNTGKLSFVPKNFRTHRSILIEPMLNTYAQKAVGSAIRRQLFFRAGIDLKDQSVNQEMASRAHRDGLATIDFSNASNTISYELVKELLPIDWFNLLDTLRTPAAEYKGSLFTLSMFSSMGNGFTFELESLIFYALAFAATKMSNGSVDSLSVYGDDVIIDRCAVDEFIKLSTFCGFSINKEKSYVDGRFFESCGKDFFDGVEVRPAYCRSLLATDYELTVIHNQLKLNADKLGFDVSKTLDFIRSLASFRGYVPIGYSGGFWPQDNRWWNRRVTSRGWEGVYANCLVPVMVLRRNHVYEGALIHSLHSPSNGTRSIRQRVVNYVPKRLFFPC